MKHKDGWLKFLANVEVLKTNGQLDRFFEIILTHAEREQIAARYLILEELLSENSSQREIAAKLGVSIFNVTRGSNQLKHINEHNKHLIITHKIHAKDC